MSRRTVDQLEIEIHTERVRVWVDGASQFLTDEKKVAVLVSVIEKTLDQWLKTRTKTALAVFGLAILGSMILAGIAWLGWKGWAGPGTGK